MEDWLPEGAPSSRAAWVAGPADHRLFLGGDGGLLLPDPSGSLPGPPPVPTEAPLGLLPSVNVLMPALSCKIPMCVCEYMCVSACVCARVYVSVCACMYECMCAHVCACVLCECVVCLCVHVRVCERV